MNIGVSLPVRELKNDLEAINAFAVAAEELGFTHLRVPDQVLRPDSGHLHEPMMFLAYLSAATTSIELVPSVIVLPARQTALFAKQAAELDVLCNGRLRLGIGVGGSEEEYRAQGMDFTNRGARCSEQMILLKQLWSDESVTFSGRWHDIAESGLNPMPVQRPIPMWIGARAVPSLSVVERIGAHADGWFVLCTPEEFSDVRVGVHAAATVAGRDPDLLGTEAGVAVVGPREAEWRSRVAGWREIGLTHLCIRTLGAGLNADEHIAKMCEVAAELANG